MNLDFKVIEIANPAAGTSALIGELGGVILELWVPDLAGIPRDVVLGYDDPHDYIDNPYHLGVMIGRYANRIREGCFVLGNRPCRLDRNNQYGDCIHGGTAGFHLQRMQLCRLGVNAVKLTLTSPDGAGGFPGNLSLQLVYTLTDDGALSLDYRAETDAATVLNLTNHTYFNLEGRESRSIAGHEVTINSDKFVETDGARGLPSGCFLEVAGHCCDLRTPARMGRFLPELPPELQPLCGFDFNYKAPGDLNTRAASVYAPASGITLEVSSTEPALGFYTGNHLDGTRKGKGGGVYPPFSGLCLESQHFPDSPNHPEFPSTRLLPCEIYRQKTVWRFRRETR
ncbi:MAG: galactose mutarotase [Victivallaceae bacterium]|nr:galactose mutarotase [Victivallaceae bacterium]